MKLFDIQVRLPGENETIACVREDCVNDRRLVYGSGVYSMSEFITRYLADHPGAQIIVREAV